MNNSQQIAKKLLQINAIKLNVQNPFTWASGIISPIYCDNRLLLSYPEIRKFVIDSFVESIQDVDSIDAIAGVATAGIAHGALIAQQLDLPFVYVRSKAKGHGRQNRIEGHLNGNERVLVIEDLISTGGSVIEAAKALEEAGCSIQGVKAIFTYGLPQSIEAFAQTGYSFDTLSNYDDLIDLAANENYIQQEDIENLKAWKTAPEKWGK